MPVTAPSPTLAALVGRLDAAMAPPDDARRCRDVKAILADVVARGVRFVPDALLRVAPDGYARRLLHRDPAGRYTIMVMVWDRGQGTPIHDHAGMWCVECVYGGEIEVTSFSLRGGDAEADRVEFAREAVTRAGVGAAGALIPPFEYHAISNPGDVPAVTIHVYGGEMTHCHVFEPLRGGGFLRGYRELVYTA